MESSDASPYGIEGRSQEGEGRRREESEGGRTQFLRTFLSERKSNGQFGKRSSKDFFALTVASPVRVLMVAASMRVLGHIHAQPTTRFEVQSLDFRTPKRGLERTFLLSTRRSALTSSLQPSLEATEYCD